MSSQPLTIGPTSTSTSTRRARTRPTSASASAPVHESTEPEAMTITETRSLTDAELADLNRQFETASASSLIRSDVDVAGYIKDHDVPVNPLIDQGYPSIGCMPCTKPVAHGEDPRSGRWSGLDKTECGMHD